MNPSSTSFHSTRRRFPLRPKSVRTPPVRYTLQPATEGKWCYFIKNGFLFSTWEEAKPARKEPRPLSKKLKV